MAFKRLLFVILSTLLAATVVSACGKSTPTSQQALDNSYSPQKSLADAVSAVLSAEQQKDPSKSFALLDPGARSTYKDVGDWTSRLNELPAVTGFHLENAEKSNQIATVDHQPGIDPFKGLSAAHEKQTWVGHKYEKGWLVEADPQTDPILPSDSKASDAAKAWTEAVQACDKDKAHAYQAIDPILASTTPALCRAPGTVNVSSPTKLVEGPDSEAIVGQYTTDALIWARSVNVTGPATFKVVLAPIGDDWKVLSVD